MQLCLKEDGIVYLLEALRCFIILRMQSVGGGERYQFFQVTFHKYLFIVKSALQSKILHDLHRSSIDSMKMEMRCSKGNYSSYKMKFKAKSNQ